MELIKVNINVSDGLFKIIRDFLYVLLAKLRKQTTPEFQNCTGILLAGGTSERWRKSVPSECEPTHKACAPLGDDAMPPIQRALVVLRNHGIDPVSVAIPGEGETREEIKSYLRPYNSNLFMSIRTSDSDLSIAESLSRAFKQLKCEEGDHVVVGYSDIIWPNRMLERLMSHKTSDIVVLVDLDWEKNYPRSRSWHDKRHAELVFSHDETFTDAGELLRSFPTMERLSDSVQRFLRSKQCVGEVVGLFRFSYRGRGKFLDFCSGMKPNTQIPLPNFLRDYCLNVPHGQQVGESEDFDKALFATFLAHFAKRCDVSIEIEPIVGSRWFEIDYWEDAKRAMKFLPHWDSRTGEIGRGAPFE